LPCSAVELTPRRGLHADRPGRCTLKIDSPRDLTGSARCCRRTAMRPRARCRVLWCTHQPAAGEFGGPWIDRLFTGTLPERHPFFRELAARAFRACAWCGAMARSCATCLRGARLAMPARHNTRPLHLNDFSVGWNWKVTDETPHRGEYQQLGRWGEVAPRSFAVR